MTAIESLGELDTPVGTLRCTLRAWEGINTHFGSYGEAYNRVAQMDAAAICVVVAHGLGSDVSKVKQSIFEFGLPKLVAPVGKYLSMLSNGGKMPDGTEDTQKGEG